MKLDYEYLKEEIFPKFLDAETSSIMFGNDLLINFDDENSGAGEVIEKFLFHWRILIDANYVDKVDGDDVRDIIRYSSDGSLNYLESSVRLTKNGQEFAENLVSAKPELVNKVKGYGIDVVKDVLKNLIVNSIVT